MLVRWPQEAVFICPDRKRVRYDELSQGQWTAGLTAIAAEEPNVAVQKNILKYLASLLQEVCDYSFPVGRGAHALVLSFIEEGRLNWLDLFAVHPPPGHNLSAISLKNHYCLHFMQAGFA